MAEGPTVALVDDPDAVEVGLDPLRRQLLDLLDAPASATELARRLDLPRQRVNYHLRQLEAVGLVELDSTRPRRGVTERLYRRIAEVVLVAPDVMADDRLDRRDRVGVAGVLGAAVSLLGHGAAVAADAAASGRRVAASTLDSTIHVESPAALRDLVDDLALLLARHDRPTSEGAIAFRAVTALLPAVEDEGG
ncbi:MAG: winged helix-turn-helix domain-containing protein [Actinomycetota bacterium]